MADEVFNAYDTVKALEERCGAKIENDRLRFHIIQTMKRLADENRRIKSAVAKVFNGYDVYDPKTQETRKRRG